MFELTVIFKHEMIELLPNIYSNFELSGTSNWCYFELTVFELTVIFKHEMIELLPNIYSNFELSGTSN